MESCFPRLTIFKSIFSKPFYIVIILTHVQNMLRTYAPSFQQTNTPGSAHLKFCKYHSRLSSTRSNHSVSKLCALLASMDLSTCRMNAELHLNFINRERQRERESFWSAHHELTETSSISSIPPVAKRNNSYNRIEESNIGSLDRHISIDMTVSIFVS